MRRCPEDIPQQLVAVADDERSNRALVAARLFVLALVVARQPLLVPEPGVVYLLETAAQRRRPATPGILRSNNRQVFRQGDQSKNQKEKQVSQSHSRRFKI